VSPKAQRSGSLSEILLAQRSDSLSEILWGQSLERLCLRAALPWGFDLGPLSVQLKVQRTGLASVQLKVVMSAYP
jgi:hypothetical protein